LKQRIAIRATIHPLGKRESAAYIRYRIKRALNREARIFTSGAVRLIVKHALGIPRVINIICDNALVAAFGRGKKEVNREVVREIIHRFSEKERLTEYLRRHAIDLAFFAATAICVVLLAISLGRGRPTPHNPSRVVFPIVREAVKPEELPAVPPSSVDKTSEADMVAEVQGPGPAPKQAGMPTEGSAAEGQNVPFADKASEVTRVVRAGDRLGRLLADVYGTSNGRLMKRVKQRNPALRDCNVIMEGATIVFPLHESR
jgi:general secretion pathway protein A